MFDTVAEQLGHMVDIYKRDAGKPAPHIPVSDKLWQAQRSSLSNVLPTLQQALSGEIQDTSIDGPTWDKFMATATGLDVLIDSLPIKSASDILPSALSALPLPRTQEELLGLMSFLSCTVAEVTHTGANNRVDTAYKDFARAGAALMLFYVQSLQDQPKMIEVLGRYTPEIQLAQMILSHEPDEALTRQSNLVFDRIQKLAIDKIDREEKSE